MQWALSDHNLVYVTRKHLSIARKIAKSINTRSYKNYNTDILSESLADTDWDFLNQVSLSPNDKWLKFTENFTSTLETICPIRKTALPHDSDPWITPAILAKISEKSLPRKHAIKTCLPADRKLATQAKNRCTNMIKKARANFIKNAETR